MGIKIENLRLAFIWMETFFDILKTPSPNSIPFGFLGRSYTYRPEVKKLLAPQKISSGLSLPWGSAAGNMFWTHYFAEKLPGHISDSLAWEKMVPLRKLPPVELIPVGAKIKPTMEAFYYPFGTVLVVTARLKGDLTLEDAIAQAHQFALTGDFNLVLKNKPIASGRLNSMAQACLEYIRKDCLASGTTSPEATSAEPLTVVTVVRGKGIDPNVALESHPDYERIHGFLVALGNWRPNWKTISPQSLKDKKIALEISSGRASPGDVLYAGNGQNRVVWFPGSFTLETPEKYSLACYHRNLVMSLLHTASLSIFVRKAIDQFPDQSYINLPNLSWCVLKSTQILSELYLGNNTYRSWSLRDYIDKSGCKTAINNVLHSQNLSLLE
ncbi:MAG: hypothetical protein ABIF04_04315 [Chloroflexota bacterium]